MRALPRAPCVAPTPGHAPKPRRHSRCQHVVKLGGHHVERRAVAPRAELLPPPAVADADGLDAREGAHEGGQLGVVAGAAEGHGRVALEVALGVCKEREGRGGLGSGGYWQLGAASRAWAALAPLPPPCDSATHLNTPVWASTSPLTWKLLASRGRPHQPCAAPLAMRHAAAPARGAAAAASVAAAASASSRRAPVVRRRGGPAAVAGRVIAGRLGSRGARGGGGGDGSGGRVANERRLEPRAH
jgi:hypothetical protein